MLSGEIKLHFYELYLFNPNKELMISDELTGRCTHLSSDRQNAFTLLQNIFFDNGSKKNVSARNLLAYDTYNTLKDQVKPKTTIKREELLIFSECIRST